MNTQQAIADAIAEASVSCRRQKVTVEAYDLGDALCDVEYEGYSQESNDTYEVWGQGEDGCDWNISVTMDPPSEPCECGEWSGEACGWTGETTARMQVDVMPLARRAKYKASGIHMYSGSYPWNGAVRLNIHEDCVYTMCETDPDWVRVVV